MDEVISEVTVSDRLLVVDEVFFLPSLDNLNCDVIACATFLRRCFKVLLSRYASNDGDDLYSCSSSFRAL